MLAAAAIGKTIHMTEVTCMNCSIYISVASAVSNTNINSMQLRLRYFCNSLTVVSNSFIGTLCYWRLEIDLRDISLVAYLNINIFSENVITLCVQKEDTISLYKYNYIFLYMYLFILN